MEQYFALQPDTLVKLIYGRSCPEPVTAEPRRQGHYYSFNSEWWLLPQNNTQHGKRNVNVKPNWTCWQGSDEIRCKQ